MIGKNDRLKIVRKSEEGNDDDRDASPKEATLSRRRQRESKEQPETKDRDDREDEHVMSAERKPRSQPDGGGRTAEGTRSRQRQAGKGRGSAMRSAECGVRSAKCEARGNGRRDRHRMMTHASR